MIITDKAQIKIAELRESNNLRLSGSDELECYELIESDLKLPADATFTRPSVAYLSDGTQVPANTPRFEPGKFGQAVLVEEGTTNIAHDPNTDNAWWNAAPTSGIAWGLSNNWSATEQALKVRSYSYSHNGHSFYLDIQRDVYFTLRAKIKNVKNALYPLFFLALYNSTGTCIKTNYVPEILAQYNWTGHNTPDYTEAWITYRIPSGVYTDAVKYTVQLVGGGASASEIYLKEIQLEQKPYKTTWHSYNSTRSPETLTIPTAGVLSPSEGTIECWVYVNDVIKRADDVYRVIWYALPVGGTANGWFVLDHFGNSANWRIAVRNGSTTAVYSISDSYTPNGWHFFSLTYNKSDGSIRLLIDGVLRFSTTGAPLSSSYDKIFVGLAQEGTRHCNTLIDDLRISSRARTDAEIAAAYASNQPLPVDEWTTYKLDFDDKVRITTQGQIICNELIEI